MSTTPNYQIESATDPLQVCRRVAIFPKKVSARFETPQPEEKLVMSFPHLVIRETICFQVVVIAMALLALFFNAPLEELANPEHTPNPAKAPWYFLGLQELLHFFPPVVAGIVLPAFVVIALIIIPYFDINLKREGLWVHNRKKTFAVISAVVFLACLVTGLYQAFDIVIPTLILYGLAILPYFAPREKGWIHWLARRSLAEWIMAWFVFVAGLLTIIGTFFRGPGWGWVWPWESGIY